MAISEMEKKSYFKILIFVHNFHHYRKVYDIVNNSQLMTNLKITHYKLSTFSIKIKIKPKKVKKLPSISWKLKFHLCIKIMWKSNQLNWTLLEHTTATVTKDTEEKKTSR